MIVIHGHELGLPRPPPCSTFRNRLRVRTPEEHCNFVEKLSVVGCSALVLLCHRLRTPLAQMCPAAGVAVGANVATAALPRRLLWFLK